MARERPPAPPPEGDSRNGAHDNQVSWAPLAVTACLLALVAALVLLQRYEALAGAMVAAVCGYWLPTRPNRRPTPTSEPYE